jgi:hypothetical protein
MNNNDTQTAKVTPERLKKIMAQVNNMLAKADDPSCTPAEAEQNRNRAEVLMARYRLDEASLSAVDKAMLGIKVQRARWTVCPIDSEFAMVYRYLVSAVINHTECEAVLTYDWSANVIVADTFGYESDLMYGERLWASIRIAFSTRLEPKHDGSLSDGANVYAMRMAGMERGRIGEVMGWGATSAQRVTSVFKRHCRDNDIDGSIVLGKGNSVKTYRNSFAEGFRDELIMRLWRMRQAAGSQDIVVKDRHNNVLEAKYEAYPRMRPVPVDHQVEPTGGISHADCPKCARAKSGYCRDHLWLKPSTAYRADNTNYRAARAGREAARSIDLGGTAGIDR